jgi:hypothetical protein
LIRFEKLIRLEFLKIDRSKFSDADSFTGLKKFNSKVSAIPEPKSVQVYKGVDHFWYGPSGRVL